MNKAVTELLPVLTKIAPARLAKVLASSGSQLEKSDWSALLYGIEELAQNGHTLLAKQMMDVCLQVADESEDEWAVRAITYFFGHVYYLQGQVVQAIETYREVVESGQEAANEDGRIQASLALSRIGQAYMSQGNIPQAVTAMKQTLALDEQMGREMTAIGSRLSLGSMYLIQEEFATSGKILGEALAQACAIGHPIFIATAHLKLAGLQEDLNNPELAINQYEKALEVLDAVEEVDDEELYLMTYRETLVGLGMAYQAMNRAKEAISYYGDASRLAYILEDTRSQAVAITWLGTAQLDDGRPYLALRSFQASARLSQQAGDIWWLGTNSFFWASAWQAIEEWDDAEKAVYQAMEYHTNAPHGANELACLLKLGEIAVAKGAFDMALDRYRQALDMLSSVDIGQIHRLIYLRLGEVYWYQCNYPQAYNMLQQALQVYENKRQTVSNLWTRVDFAPSRDVVYEYMARTCIALEKTVEAFMIAEEGRMRVFREQLAEQFIIDEMASPYDWSGIKSLLRAGT